MNVHHIESNNGKSCLVFGLTWIKDDHYLKDIKRARKHNFKHYISDEYENTRLSFGGTSEKLAKKSFAGALFIQSSVEASNENINTNSCLFLGQFGSVFWICYKNNGVIQQEETFDEIESLLESTKRYFSFADVFDSVFVDSSIMSVVKKDIASKYDSYVYHEFSVSSIIEEFLTLKTKKDLKLKAVGPALLFVLISMIVVLIFPIVYFYYEYNKIEAPTEAPKIFVDSKNELLNFKRKLNERVSPFEILNEIYSRLNALNYLAFSGWIIDVATCDYQKDSLLSCEFILSKSGAANLKYLENAFNWGNCSISFNSTLDRVNISNCAIEVSKLSELKKDGIKSDGLLNIIEEAKLNYDVDIEVIAEQNLIQKMLPDDSSIAVDNQRFTATAELYTLVELSEYILHKKGFTLSNITLNHDGNYYYSVKISGVIIYE